LGETAQERALKQYRGRLAARGMARFEVLGLEGDRLLIRELARRLAENDAKAAEIRAAVRGCIAGRAPSSGGILAALRRAPPEAAELDLTRSREDRRVLDL
jgi:hypothetical protein